MEYCDNLFFYKISEYLNNDIFFVLLVSKKWYSIFHSTFLYIKPKVDKSTTLDLFINHLKIGYHYDKYQTICNISCYFHEFNNHDKEKLIAALINKLYLEKPALNYVSLKKQIVIDKYLVNLI